MEEVISRLLEGDFEYENGTLDFSCAKLELTIKRGESKEGSFKILGEPGRYTKGTITSTDGRMECLTTEFVGTEEEILFCFHGDHLVEGDVVKGEFCVVSNQGEYYLPFVVTVEYTQLTSSLGNVKNLFHFANLAKANPKEAVTLFYSPDFEKILTGSDKQYYTYYRALSAIPGNEQNVEEFLIGINKKQKIEYLTDVQELQMEDPEGIEEINLTITRNGWGYTELAVETEGDFLYTEKTEITDDDFLGNICRLPVYVDASYLHAGNNYGCVRLHNSYVQMEIPVFVKNHGVGLKGRKNREKKHRLLQLMELYQAFRLKKISTATWLKESNHLVEKMTSGDEKDVTARLFQAQLLITEERSNEAQWILDHVAELLDIVKDNEPVLEAYYLYLTSLIRREENYVNKVTGQVEQIYKKNRGAWRVAWLLLYLSEEYSRSATKKWMFLESQIEMGCYSPVIYIEALLLLNRNPSLLMKLGKFERHVLSYGAKQELLSKDVVMQFLYLVQKEKDFSPFLYRILEKCYKTQPDTAILQEICSMLIKGSKTGPKWYEWYRLGVEKELRITRLYEYYMLSVDRDKIDVLPKIILMYFSYQNTLQYDLAAFLYANVYRNREKFPDLYQNYLHTIEQFITEQILKRHINRDLAYLYKNLVTPRMLTGEVADALAEILFVHQIQVNNKRIRNVIVYRNCLSTEQCYPVSEGKAFVSLPGTECTVIFEDERKHRFITGVQHIIEKLLLPGKPAKQIAPLVGNKKDFNIYQCINGKEPAEITDENVERFRYLLADEDIVPEIKRTVYMRLLQYYYDRDRMQELDTYLTTIEPGLLSATERGEVMRYMLMCGQEQRAKDWLQQYGPYNADAKALVKLCTVLIRDTDFAQDDLLTESVWYAFRKGKYDERCLQYLMMHYKGLTGRLRDIWKAAEAFGMNTAVLSERILIQMLFSGAFVGEKMDIFRSYISEGAKPDVEMAFLAHCAYEYYVKDRVATDYLFRVMTALHKQGETLQKVCKLSYIKYYSENSEEITEETKQIAKEFIYELLRENIRLKMFWEFADTHDKGMANQLADKTIVEYKAHPQARAVMHYCVETAEGEEAEYRTEEMDEVYGGVSFKDFVLFFGERLQYYIMEQRDGSEQLTESATIQKSDAGSQMTEGKFALLNDLSISTTLQDYGTVDKLLEEYEYQEFMKNGLFKLR